METRHQSSRLRGWLAILLAVSMYASFFHCLKADAADFSTAASMTVSLTSEKAPTKHAALAHGDHCLAHVLASLERVAALLGERLQGPAFILGDDRPLIVIGALSPFEPPRG